MATKMSLNIYEFYDFRNIFKVFKDILLLKDSIK